MVYIFGSEKAKKAFFDRRRIGQATIETAAVFIALVPALLGLVDIVVTTSSMQVNDAACRDAARLAAAGPPVHLEGLTDPLDTPEVRAASLLKNVYHAGGYVIKGPILGIPANDTTAPDPNPKVTINVDPGVCGGWYQGSVTLETEIDINLPVPFPLIPSPVKLYARQSFPITYQRPRDPTQCPAAS